jgi:hypothetical protein
MAGHVRIRLRHAGRASGIGTAAVVLVIAITMCGCVPIPYRPSASVTHKPVTAEESSVITLGAARNFGMLESLSKSIQHAEPRVALVDGNEYLHSLGAGTLAEVVARRDAASPSSAAATADYLLCVGSPVHRQLHDTGAAAPFIYFPAFWVGYEKIQSRESLVASLVDLHAPTPVDGLQVSSTYSEVIASLVYGVGTIAMPQSALREALAKEVAHALGSAHPVGPIRLIVLGQKGGTAEPDPKAPGKPAAPVVARADAAMR